MTGQREGTAASGRVRGMDRRRFFQAAAAGAAGLALGPEALLGAEAASDVGGRSSGVHLVILHTNDTHSRIDPFPVEGSRFPGLGGVTRRATLIRRVREANANVLLLDAGDTFQGTPYFNFFRGELEFRTMSAMGYDATTLGNHDFDNGVEGLAEVMPHAAFDFVSANYDVSGSPLEERVRRWIIREVEDVRVGIFGLGIEFEGLVLPGLHRGVGYTDPIASARNAVEELHRQGCSLTVALSHLGWRYRDDTVSDQVVARSVPGLDIILGGHTHTFMDEPETHRRPDGGRCLIHQVGWGGVRLGRIDLRWEGEGAEPAWSAGSYRIDSSLD